MRVGVRYSARSESISKRARSTTPTSLRLESTICGRSGQCNAGKRSFKSLPSAMRFEIIGLRACRSGVVTWELCQTSECPSITYAIRSGSPCASASPYLRCR